ncbi:MAG: hypothetical protein ACI3V3_07695 [Faecousia sp.]
MRMELMERNPLPAVCLACQEPDCWECDHAGERWIISEQDRLLLDRKLKEQAIARYQRKLMAPSL